MKLTFEQEAELKKMTEVNENQTLYICQQCNKKLIGMKNVRKHIDEKKHYTYKNPKHLGNISFLIG